MRFIRAALLLGLAAFLLVSAAQFLIARESERGAVASQRIGLFTSLPILWPEAADIGGLLHDRSPPHWALSVLRETGEVVPLDILAQSGGREPLDGLTVLVMAQPRPLSPAENVALDEWVRGGGHVILFADPMLTSGSAFALGDPRRPQDVAMLSPILTRWGLRLEFVEDQSAGQGLVPMRGTQGPVDLPGRFALVGGAHSCQLRDNALIALCRPGKGTVLAMADAALLDHAPGESPAARVAVLRRIMEAAGT